MTTLEALALEYAFEVAGTELGPYHAMSDLSSYNQSETWHCHGCDAECYSYWKENWRLEFIHAEGCKYVALLKLLGKDQHAELAKIAGEDRCN